MITMVRTRLKDLSVRSFHEFEIVSPLNEGKNELVKIIRQADENFFETTFSGTIPVAAAPDPSEITLPSDFSELREIRVVSSGYEDMAFINLSQSDRRFRDALAIGGGVTSGQSAFYYDFMGLDKIILAPGSDMALAYEMGYIQTVPDMMLPDSYPVGIPPEDYDYIVTWGIVEGLRSVADKRLPAYLTKLEDQKQSVIQSVNSRQVR